MIFRKSMMKWLLLLSVLISLCVLVPATLAFMFDQAGPIVNTFVPPKGLDGQAPVQIDITKKVICDGPGIMSPAGFQFVLEDSSNGQKLTATSNAEGKASIQLLYSGKDAGKTFEYTLYELNTGVKDVTYSNAKYTITVQVQLAGDALVAVVRLNGAETAKCEVSFVNRYFSEVNVAPPPTGDLANPALYMLLMAVCSAMIILLYGYSQKESKKSQK